MTTLSRRQLLGLGVTAAGAVALAGPMRWLGTGVDAAASSATTGRRVTADVSAWRSAIGSKFAVTDSFGRHHSLTLQSVSPLRADPALSGDGLLLLFNGPASPVVPPTFSAMRHPTIGGFVAPLLAVDRPGKRQTYQLMLDQRRLVSSGR